MNELGLIFIRGDKIALRRIRKVCKTVACKWSMGIGRKASLCKMSMYWGQYAKWAFLWAFGLTLFAFYKKTPAPHCLKITQNVAYEFLNFGIFYQFLSY